MRTLPAPPAIALRVVREGENASNARGGFLDVRRVMLAATFPDGHTSAPFAYDTAERVAIDAVVMVVHHLEAGQRHVYLRSAIRPPCALRAQPPAVDAALWELPAGLIEPGESPADAAAREIAEELGFVVAPASLAGLGPWTLPSPGVIAERHLFFHVEVDPATRGVPSEDGSALERGAAIVSMPLADALEHCRLGRLPDAKTELGLRRLAELISGRGTPA